jgi:hypothetical protein
LGTVQFGERTVAAMGVLLSQSREGQRVNSVFGKGVNLRLRKLRAGLEELGLDADELLNHAAPRLAYAVNLVKNLREYLLGIDARPKYIVPLRDPQAVSAQIVRWWLERWVARRVQRPDVLARIAEQTLVHPIRHGARVKLLRTDPE